MGVYIKGMEMPYSCITCRMECIVRIHDSTKRSEDCPLVYVPTPHGRLIDADKQWEVCKELVNDVLFPMDSIDEAEIVGMVKNTRTVIESED